MFASFDVAKADGVGGKVKKAMRQFTKDATESGWSETEVNLGTAGAKAALALVSATLNETLFLSAAPVGGETGRDQCRERLSQVVAEEISSDTVHPVLFEQVNQLLKGPRAT